MAKDEKSSYYDAGGIETIEIIKAKLTPEQFKGYLLGNVLKYSSRLNFKGFAKRDIEKLATYSNWLRETLNLDSVIVPDLKDLFEDSEETIS